MHVCVHARVHTCTHTHTHTHTHMYIHTYIRRIVLRQDGVQLNGKLVVVNNAATRLGSALCAKLLRCGANVIVSFCIKLFIVLNCLIVFCNSRLRCGANVIVSFLGEWGFRVCFKKKLFFCHQSPPRAPSVPISLCANLSAEAPMLL